MYMVQTQAISLAFLVKISKSISQQPMNYEKRPLKQDRKLFAGKLSAAP